MLSRTPNAFGRQNERNLRRADITWRDPPHARPDPGGLTIYGGTDYGLMGLLQSGQSITGEVIEVAGGAAMFMFNNAAPISESSTASLLGLGTLCLTGLMLTARLKARRVI